MTGSAVASEDAAPAAALGNGRDLVVVVEQAAEQGGMERVVGSVLRRWPAARVVAPAFTASNGPPEAQPDWTGRVELVGPELARRRQVLVPLYARRMASAPTREARLVLSFAAHGWSLAVPLSGRARHVCYRAGASRPLTGDLDEYMRDEGPILRSFARAALPALRAHQVRLARRANRTITPSRWSAATIAEHLGVQAEVVGNPVETGLFTPSARPRRHVLCVGRMVWHKRLDLLLDAARELPDEQFVVVGDGPALETLRALGPPNVRFTGWVPDAELVELYRAAWALVHPKVEEFGLTMAEALASGTPVVAPRAGGVLDMVDGRGTGVLLAEVTGWTIAGALRELRESGHDPAACRRAAARFEEGRFLDRLERVLRSELALSRAA